MHALTMPEHAPCTAPATLQLPQLLVLVQLRSQVACYRSKGRRRRCEGRLAAEPLSTPQAAGQMQLPTCCWQAPAAPQPRLPLTTSSAHKQVYDPNGFEGLWTMCSCTKHS